jgi:adenylosuccinate synthase
MAVTAVVGAQWGDEGKGRVVDYLAQQADMVIRFQGGDNAGHTVVNDLGTFRLHLVPSGIFNPATRCILGTGMVVNPATLLEEMADLAAHGVSLDNLWLSERAQMVMPYHRLLDGLEEKARRGAAIGTTGRGIGPSYADKAARDGLRLGDLVRPDHLRARLSLVLPARNRTIEFLGGEPFDLETLLAQCLDWGERLKGRIIDVLLMIRAAVEADRQVLLEGQLGVMRDLDWGIYPFVTSSSPTSGGGSVGAGIPPRAIGRVLGVVKAYSTCVGAGPFPVELKDEVGRHLQNVGQEYGATTGRPRRCGWLDGVALRHSGWLNGFTHLAVTKLDVLDGLPELKICTGYRLDGRVVNTLPYTPDLDRVEPVYETWPGWQTPTRDARHWEELPDAARRYLRRIEELAGAPIALVSVGPERSQMIVVDRDLLG